MYSATEKTINTTASEESLDFLFKNFTIAIGTLVGISAVVELLMHLFVPGM